MVHMIEQPVISAWQKPTHSEDTAVRPLLQPSPTVTEPPIVQRKRGLSSVSFLSDAMDGGPKLHSKRQIIKTTVV